MNRTIAPAVLADDFVKARIPHRMKEEATEVLAGLGMKPSQLIRLVFATVARDGAVPAVLLKNRRKTVAAFEEAKAGKGRGYASVSALMADLNDGED